MTTRSATSHHDEVSDLLACRPEHRRYGIAVNYQAAVSDGGLDERSAPLSLEPGRHLASVSRGWHEGRIAEVCQQAEGMDRNDLSTGTFDESGCPSKGAPGVFGAVDTDHDATGHAHDGCPGARNIWRSSTNQQRGLIRPAPPDLSRVFAVPGQPACSLGAQPVISACARLASAARADRPYAQRRLYSRRHPPGRSLRITARVRRGLGSGADPDSRRDSHRDRQLTASVVATNGGIDRER